jgi:hypothetical protein
MGTIFDEYFGWQAVSVGFDHKLRSVSAHYVASQRQRMGPSVRQSLAVP